MKILDLYLCFPYFLKKFKFPQGLNTRKIINKISKPYEELPSEKILMFRLNEIQNFSFNFLVSKGLFNKNKFTKGIISYQEEFLNNYKFQNSIPEVMEILVKMAAIEVDGKGGLKDRSGLMEYRYDTNESFSLY